MKIVEVTEQKVSASLELRVRVYPLVGGSALASSLATPEEVKQLPNAEFMPAEGCLWHCDCSDDRKIWLNTLPQASIYLKK